MPKSNITNITTTLGKDKVCSDYGKSKNDTTDDSGLSRATMLWSEFGSTGVSDSIAKTNEFSLLHPKFRDVCYGEPFKAQCVTIDFTPRPGVDDSDAMLKQCCDFWDFFDSQPALQMIMASPDVAEDYVYKTIENEPDDLGKVEEKPSKEELTGIDWMEIIPMETLVNGREKYCIPSDHDYRETPREDSSKDILNSSRYKNQGQVQPAFPTKATIKMQSYKTRNTEEEIKKMFEDMDAFDKKNPKSFAPPGKPPEKCTVVMQRAYLPAIQ